MGNKEEKPAKLNFSEMVSEARIAQTIKDEEELSNNDIEVRRLKIETIDLIMKMEHARTEENEFDRRKWRNEIVILNLRLVTQVLKKYGYFSQDKFQNGCVGLLKAAESFASEKGVPFHNYACFCIETEVRLAFRRVNRLFESKKQGFLTSFDAASNAGGEDREMNAHDSVEDPYAFMEFDEIINDAEVDTLFYDIIIPCIEEYGVRSKDMDMVLWRQLEIQYFIELSMEHSQRQRITFTEMAKQLGTATQNIRTRHKKVMELVKKRCNTFGYYIDNAYGRARVVKQEIEAVTKMNQHDKQRGYRG